MSDLMSEWAKEDARRSSLTPIERFAEDWPRISTDVRAEVACRLARAAVSVIGDAKARAATSSDMPGRERRENQIRSGAELVERLLCDLANEADGARQRGDINIVRPAARRPE